ACAADACRATSGNVSSNSIPSAKLDPDILTDSSDNTVIATKCVARSASGHPPLGGVSREWGEADLDRAGGVAARGVTRAVPRLEPLLSLCGGAVRQRVGCHPT